MSAEDIREKLNRYLDGDVDETTRREIEVALQQDPLWRTMHQEINETSKAVKSYFRISSNSLGEDPQGEAMAVERIVRESTMSLRKSAIHRWSRGSWSQFATRNRVALAVGILAALSFAVAFLLSSRKPDAERLFNSATEGVQSGYYALRISLRPAARGLASFVGRELDIEKLPTEVEAEVGPDQLIHARLPVGRGQRHFGCDGEIYWTWANGADEVRIVDPKKIGEFQAILDVAEIWKSCRTRIEKLRQSPSGLAMVGEVDSSSETRLWKIEAPVEGLARMFFFVDENGSLSRIDLPYFTIDVAERRLTAEHFEIKNWAPGARIKDDR